MAESRMSRTAPSTLLSTHWLNPQKTKRNQSRPFPPTGEVQGYGRYRSVVSPSCKASRDALAHIDIYPVLIHRSDFAKKYSKAQESCDLEPRAALLCLRLGHHRERTS